MDITRHRSVYDPAKINGRGRPVLIVGAGALGSQVALQLFKLGIRNISIVDFDVVEAHNLPNQLVYGYRDIGKFKAETLAIKLNAMLSNEPDHAVSPLVTSSGQMDKTKLATASAIFVCTDSMSSREEIARFMIAQGHYQSLLIEGRMGAYGGDAHIINLGVTRDTAWYLNDCLYPDSEVVPDTGSCGETLNIGPTASITASMMVWLFMQHDPIVPELNWNCTKQVSFSVNPWAMTAHSL